MTNRLNILLLLMFGRFSGFEAQTLSLYYGINEYEATQHTQRLDSLLDTHRQSTYNVKIYGFADFLHSEEYNRELSLKRANAARRYLMSKTSEPQMTVVICKGMGEKNSSDNGSSEGEPSQRRVDVVVEVQHPIKHIDTRPVTFGETPVIAEFPDDIEEIVAGRTFVLEGLSFEPGRHVLLKSSVPVLERLLQTMKENPGLKIEIQGHVCCTPGVLDAIDQDTGGKELSVNRARAIRNYLLSNGIDKSRLSFRGFGHARPLVQENTLENEQKNRRVEIFVVEK